MDWHREGETMRREITIISEGTEAGNPTGREKRTAGPARPLAVRLKGELTWDWPAGGRAGTTGSRELGLSPGNKHGRSPFVHVG